MSPDSIKYKSISNSNVWFTVLDFKKCGNYNFKIGVRTNFRGPISTIIL